MPTKVKESIKWTAIVIPRILWTEGYVKQAGAESSPAWAGIPSLRWESSSSSPICAPQIVVRKRLVTRFPPNCHPLGNLNLARACPDQSSFCIPKNGGNAVDERLREE